jgi:hypothetical protein
VDENFTFLQNIAFYVEFQCMEPELNKTLELYSPQQAISSTSDVSMPGVDPAHALPTPLLSRTIDIPPLLCPLLGSWHVIDQHMNEAINGFWSEMGYPWLVRHLIARVFASLCVAQMNVKTGYTDSDAGIVTFPVGKIYGQARTVQPQFDPISGARPIGSSATVPPLGFPLDARVGNKTKYIIKGGVAGTSNAHKLAYQIVNTHMTGVDEGAGRCFLEYLTPDPSYFFSFGRVSIQQIFNSEDRAQWHLDLYDVDGDGLPRTMQRGQWIRRTVALSLSNDGGLAQLHLHMSCYEYDSASGEWDRLRAAALIKYVR